MAVNLKEELQGIRSKGKEEDQKNLFLTEAKLLLENNEKEEIDALRAIGLDESIEKMEKEKSDILEREQFEGKNGETFSESEIKDLCIMYNLRFLQTIDSWGNKIFKGNLSPEVGVKLVRYAKENDINDLSSSYYKKSFYIASPAKSFNLQKKPKDPLLFHKIGDVNGEGQFKLVHKWGNDFTNFRYFTSFLHRSFMSAYISSFFMSWILVTFVLGICGVGSAFGIGTIIVSLIVSLLPTWLFNRRGDGDWSFASDHWNSEFK